MQSEGRNKTCACIFVVCHLGPPAWESQGSAATLPCPQDRAEILPASPEQYSQLNICHWHISNMIKPSQVSSASVPEWSEKLAQVTGLLRRKVEWQRLWWQGNMGPASAAGWVGRRMMGSFSVPRPVSCQRLCTSDLACARLQFSSQPCQLTGFPSQPSRGLSLLPAALGHSCGAHVGLLPPLPKSSRLPSCCNGRESSHPLEEQQIFLQRNGHGCPSCTEGSARTRGLPVGWDVLLPLQGKTAAQSYPQ